MPTIPDSDPDDLRLNPTVSVSLTYRLVTPDGQVVQSHIPLVGSDKIAHFLQDAGRLKATGSSHELEVDPGIVEEIKSRSLLLTAEERRRLVLLKDSPELRPADIIIATYPKSGTTWVQMMVYQLISNGSLEFRHMDSVCPYLPDTGVVTRWLRDHISLFPDRRFYKTHSVPDMLPRQCKFIYVFRNPKDVLVSYYHHLKSTNEFFGTLDQFADAFVDGRVTWGSWFNHMREWWTMCKQSNVLSLSYEQISENFAGSLKAIAQFCEVDIDPRRCPAINEACSFRFMKMQGYKFDPRPLHSSGTPFFRKGVVGSAEVELSSEKAQLVDLKTTALIRDLDPDLSAPNMPAWWKQNWPAK